MVVAQGSCKGTNMREDYLYTVYQIGEVNKVANRWQVVKIHRTTRIEESHYEISRTSRSEWLCDCMAGHNSTCRHREMVFLFNKSHKTGTGALMEYDKNAPKWVEK